MKQIRPWRLRTADAWLAGADPAVLVASRCGSTDPQEQQQFLAPSLKDLPPPDSLHGIDEAAALLAHHARNGVIGICGDYDADGVCGTSLGVKALRALGAEVRWTIPNRFEDGYGLNPRLVRRLVQEGATMVVTVDNGIKAYEAAQEARTLGVPLLITDHHLPDPEALPDATCIVNPNQDADTSAFGYLSGTGVLFYVLARLRSYLRQQGDPQAESVQMVDYLDLVAIATIADIVPLQGANRILVRAGLERLQTHPPFWLQTLREINVLRGERLTSKDISFGIAPRLNAAGRMQDPGDAVRFLLAETLEKARLGSEQLDRMNRARRVHEEKVVQASEKAGQTQEKGIPVVAASPDWHPGVIGIAAAKLARKIEAPVLLGTIREGKVTCSGRSIPGFDLHGALEEIKDQFDVFGGHAMAAGLTMDEENLPAVQTHLQQRYAQALQEGLLDPLYVDAVLGIKADARLHSVIQNMEPFGRDNEAPVFAVVHARVKSQYKMKNKHLKAVLEFESADRQPVQVTCLGWDFGRFHPLPKENVHVLGTLECDEYRGVTSYSLRLLDIRYGPEPLEAPR